MRCSVEGSTQKPISISTSRRARLGIKVEPPDVNRSGVAFEVKKVPARPLQQVFVHDPDGVMIELNFWHEEDVAELAGYDPMANKVTAEKQKVPA